MLTRETEQHAVDQRRQIEAEQRLRPQQAEPPRAVDQDARADDAGVGNARQQQRVAPDQDAGAHAGDGAEGGATPPDQSAEKRRRQLRHGGEGQEPDRGELRLAGRMIVDVGEQQDDEDGDAARGQ